MTDSDTNMTLNATLLDLVRQIGAQGATLQSIETRLSTMHLDVNRQMADHQERIGRVEQSNAVQDERLNKLEDTAHDALQEHVEFRASINNINIKIAAASIIAGLGSSLLILILSRILLKALNLQ